MKNVTLMVLLASCVTLSACEPSTPEKRQRETEQRVERNNNRTRLIATVDGCRIWEVYNEDGTNPFFARCPEGSADTFNEYRSNKQTKQTFTLGDQ